MLNFFQKISFDSHGLQSFFYKGETVFLMGFLLFIWFLRPRSPSSQFRSREADIQKKNSSSPGLKQPDLLAYAKVEKKERLQLTGMRIDQLPHEILGVSSNPTSSEIQKAYRDLMKRYHPDRVGLQGSREWQDAQKIAEAINQAKETLFAEIKKKAQ